MLYCLFIIKYQKILIITVKKPGKAGLYQTMYTIMVWVTGLEPARSYHQDLNLARLPIPPHPLIFLSYYGSIN